MCVSCDSYLRGTWGRAADRFSRQFPSFSDPDRRPAFTVYIPVVMLHIVFCGALFLFDGDLIEKTKHEPWYTAIYVLLFIATLVQFFVTAGTSPGYVLDVQKAVDEGDAAARRTLLGSKQPASSMDDDYVITVDGRINHGTAWTKLVTSLYPQRPTTGSLICYHCNIIQPPRSKHCHDCDKCVLQFDHHCLWLGTCIGQGNHCRFWWYICEEAALSVWTVVLYIEYLKSNILKAWWADIMLIILLVVLSCILLFLVMLIVFHSYLIVTNQTTYEIVKWRRVVYLRDLGERVCPFNQGVCRNLKLFCCDRSSSMYGMERLPTTQELQGRSRPYTSCRCC